MQRNNTTDQDGEDKAFKPNRVCGWQGLRLDVALAAVIAGPLPIDSALILFISSKKKNGGTGSGSVLADVVPFLTGALAFPPPQTS